MLCSCSWAPLIHHLLKSMLFAPSRNTDVLVFPSIQRHRYFRIKQRLPWAAGRALQLASVAFAAAMLTCATAGQLGGSSGTRRLLRLAAAPAPAVAALLAGALCAFGWLAGAAVLEVVLTERLRPDDYCDRDVLGAMAACLSGGKGPLMRDLALHDLSLLATADVSAAAWRRQEVWADESGERWKPLGDACLAQLAVVQHAAAAALPQGAAPAAARGATSAATGGQGQARRWNVLPAVSVRGGLGVNRPQAEALLTLRASYQARRG